MNMNSNRLVTNLTYTYTWPMEDGPSWDQDRYMGDGRKLEDEVVQYLDSSKQLDKLEECITAHKHVIEASRENGEVEPPLRLVVDVDFTVLSDIAPSGLLSDKLLQDPLTARQAFRDVVLCVVRSIGGLPDMTYEQVDVALRPRSLPTTVPGLAMHGLRLRVMTGILVSRTQVKKYIHSAWLCCLISECDGASGVRVPGTALAPSTACTHCGTKMREVPRARIFGSEVIGILMDQRAVHSAAFSRFQGTPVRFRDELTSDLELGTCYNVTGRMDGDIFDAWNVHRWYSAAALNAYLGQTPELPGTLGQLRAQLLRDCPESPWALPAIVASRLGDAHLPVGSFRNLKMGLLLSLASLGGDRPAHILAVGADDLSAHSLLNLTSRLAPRCLASPVGCPVGGVAQLDQDGCYWSEAGTLVLASGGVCYMGDWAKYRLATQRSRILAALESCRVTLDCQGSTIASGPTSTTPSFPLRAAVWSYWPSDPHRDTLAAKQKQLRTLIQVFGIPCLADEGRDEDSITKHILMAAISGGKQPVEDKAIPQEEMREYISLAIARKVTLGQRATQLIRDYFVVSRRVRPDCLPVGAISTITALSEAHARLALRSGIVTYDDVLAVLCLYEETISSLFGHCYMTPPPTRNLHNPAQLDAEMRQFGAWIDTFIKSVLGDNLASLLPEE